MADKKDKKQKPKDQVTAKTGNPDGDNPTPPKEKPPKGRG